MAGLMLNNIEIKKDILAEEKYKYLFSVEEVNNLVNKGMAFRDAYKKIGLDIESGNFKPTTSVNHSHEGSIGNLCNAEISEMMQRQIAAFPFNRVQAAMQGLLKSES